MVISPNRSSLCLLPPCIGSFSSLVEGLILHSALPKMLAGLRRGCKIC